MSIKLTPLEDKIIVKQAEAQTQTASGLYIPDNAKEKPQQGEVLYSKYGGTEVHYEGEDYLIVGARDILAILG